MLEGLTVALVTPFNKNLTVNYKKIGELIEFHYENNTDCLLILGTTAETPTLSEHEKDQIVEYVIKKNNKRMKIMVGVTSNSTAIACKKGKKYEELGADYLLVISPFYNKTNDEGLILHFTTIANAVKIPIILYNIPGRTGINISSEIMKKLKVIHNIIGVKEASTDIKHILDVAFICDDNFKLYCGNDDMAILYHGLNVDRYISVYGNINPSFFKNLMKMNLEDACLYFYKHYDLLKNLFIDTNPIPIKTLMNYLNFNIGWFRLPLTNMNDFKKQKLINSYLETIK